MNTTQEAVAELKNTIKTKVVEPIWVFWSETIGLSLRTKIILLIMATIFMFGLLVHLVHSVYQSFNM